jgi:hypothetical protein
MKRYHKVFRWIGIIAGWVLLVAWFWSAAFDNAAVTWTRRPTPENGHIIPYPVKGITVYVTAGDRTLVTWLTRVEIGSGVVLMLMILLSGEWRKITSLQSK